MEIIDKKQVVDELRKFAVSKDADAFGVDERLKDGTLSINIHEGDNVYIAHVFNDFISVFGAFDDCYLNSLEEFTNHLKTL
jgi:hypothetical protein